MPADTATCARGALIASSCAALTVVAGLGALNLQYPFVADQVMAFFAAKTVAGGGALYVDFWDNKLPGLVWFYLLAGTLFGFSELGVHLLELIWMLGFALVLIVTLRRELAMPWAVAVVPVAVIGTYYAAADPFHLTQLEMLVALPVFLAAWFTTRLEQPPRRLATWQFLSGVCAGVTVVFKIVFAPLFVVFWLIAMGYALRRHGRSLREVGLYMALPVTAGVVCVLALVVGWFWYRGTLWELYWTAFVYPPAALESAPPATPLRLLGSTLFFAGYYAAWLPFVVVGVLDWWHGRREPLWLLLMVWLVVGVVLILIQRFSWWQYHFLFLFAPAGILGVRGCVALPARLLGRGQISRAQGTALLALLLLAPCGTLAVPVVQKLSAYIEVMVIKPGDFDDLRRFVNPGYAEIEHSVRFLRQETARKGRIYVFGDPLFYFLSGREPALPIIGWPWEYYLNSQWAHLAGMLERARPPYVYVDKDSRKLMEHRGGGVLEVVVNDYMPFATNPKGSWYQLRRDLVRE